MLKIVPDIDAEKADTTPPLHEVFAQARQALVQQAANQLNEQLDWMVIGCMVEVGDKNPANWTIQKARDYDWILYKGEPMIGRKTKFEKTLAGVFFACHVVMPEEMYHGKLS